MSTFELILLSICGLNALILIIGSVSKAAKALKKRIANKKILKAQAEAEFKAWKKSKEVK